MALTYSASCTWLSLGVQSIQPPGTLVVAARNLVVVASRARLVATALLGLDGDSKVVVINVGRNPEVIGHPGRALVWDGKVATVLDGGDGAGLARLRGGVLIRLVKYGGLGIIRVEAVDKLFAALLEAGGRGQRVNAVAKDARASGCRVGSWLLEVGVLEHVVSIFDEVAGVDG